MSTDKYEIVDVFIILTIVCLTALGIGVILGATAENIRGHRIAVSRGHAKYVSDANGASKFTWLPRCKYYDYCSHIKKELDLPTE